MTAAPGQTKPGHSDACADKNKVQSTACLDKNDCLEISQDCLSAGRVNVIISHDAVKLTNHLSNLTLLYAPPYTDVVAYSDKSKKVFTCPAKSFKSPFATTLLTFDAITFCNLPMKESKQVAWQGLTISKMNLPKAAVKNQTADLPKSERRRTVSEADLETTAKFSLEPKVANFVSAAYSLPPTGALPLKFDFTTMMEPSRHYLVSSAAKSATLARDTFTSPKNYKSVKSLELVTSDDNTQAGIEFMTGR